MNRVEFPQVNKEWAAVARSINHNLRPTVRVTLCDVTFTLRAEARPAGSDRDYAILRQLARGKQCIFDVGANVGLTSLVMAGPAPAGAGPAEDGRIIAFEASEAACRLIRDNAALNGLSGRISVVNALVAERSGLALDFYGDAASGSASIIPGYLAHHHPLRKVTLALDDFVNDFGLVPDLIKIDVEGAELRVVAGLVETLRTARPLAFIELHSWGDLTVDHTADALLEQLRPLDYCLVYLRTKEIVTDTAVLAGRGRCHVLACPNESPFLDTLAQLDTAGL
ncbi:MAG: FkbM family methyltransferase [Candidatus Promineofilum sp.]|nr:FkbM family methyltransferase [Promineifilum sp.]